MFESLKNIILKCLNRITESKENSSDHDGKLIGKFDQITCFCSHDSVTAYLYFEQNGYDKFIVFLKKLNVVNYHEISLDDFVTITEDKEFSPIYKIIFKEITNDNNSPKLTVNFDSTLNTIYFLLNKPGIIDLIDSIDCLKQQASKNRNDDISYMLHEWGNDSCILQNKILEDNTSLVCHLRLYNVIP